MLEPTRRRRIAALVAALRLPLPAAWSAAEPEVVPPPRAKSEQGRGDEAAPPVAAATSATAPAKTASPSNTDSRCDRCGSCKGVRRICLPKPVVREKTKVCWSAKEELQCIPGQSIPCGTRCGRDECGCYEVDLWKPTCARVITKTVPVKREVTRKVPGFEWTVEERCCDCRQASGREQAITR